MELITDDGRLASDLEDGTCEWNSPTYVLRDGAGEVIDLGDVRSDLAQEGNAEDDGTALGEARGAGSDYSCALTATIEAPDADVYELEITTVAGDGAGRISMPGDGEEFSGSAMTTRARAAEESISISVDGPPLPY